MRKTLANEGARGHLSPSQDLPTCSSEHIELAGKYVSQFIESPTTQPECPICKRDRLLPNGPQKKRASARETKLLLYQRNFEKLRRDITANDYGHQLTNALRAIKNAGNCYVIGAGGSYPAAVFIAQLINHKGNGFAQPIKPLDYIRLGVRTDTVLVITYSGKTEDCARAIEKAKDVDAGSIVLITFESDPVLANKLREKNTDYVISYELNSGREKGFVSIRGTVLPCALFSRAALTEKNDFPDLIKSIGDHFNKIDSKNFVLSSTNFMRDNADKVRDNCIFEAFGSGYSNCSMIDLESKFTEGGLNPIRIHESKDFSHGRFMSLLPSMNRNNINLFFSVGELSGYELSLFKRLRANNLSTYLVQSTCSGLLGSLELLILSQYLVRIVAEITGKDISKPRNIPKWGLDFYYWSKDLS